MGVLIGYSNRINSAILSGGSWTVGLPLQNVQTRILGQVARTLDQSNANSTFNIDFGVTRNIQVASLVNHNISLSGKIRIKASGETVATNLLPYSEDATHWSNNGAAYSYPYGIAPDGTLSSTLINSLTGTRYIFSNTTVGQKYTYSEFVKAGTTRTVSIYIDGLGGPSQAATFDLTLGVCTDISSGLADSKIQPVGNGWFRISASYIALTAACNFHIYPASGSAEFWGVQLEVGSMATSYISTHGATATRTAGYMDSWQSYSYDSGVIDVWPAVYNFGDLEWEDDAWWSGTYTAEDAEGYTTNITHIVSSLAYYRYWRIDILDDTNPDGYIQLGRVFLGSAWQPKRDAEVGLALGWETNTVSQRALSGTKYFQHRNPYRVTKFTLNVMDIDEALTKAFEIDKRMGIDGEVLFVQDTNDTLHSLRRRYLGTLRELSLIEFPYVGLGKKAYSIEESV